MTRTSPSTCRSRRSSRRRSVAPAVATALLALTAGTWPAAAQTTAPDVPAAGAPHRVAQGTTPPRPRPPLRPAEQEPVAAPETPAAEPAATPGDALALTGPDRPLGPETPAEPGVAQPQPARPSGLPVPAAVAPALGPSARTALAQAILTVDQEAIYRRSRWGQRAEAEIAEQSRKVAADNDTAFAALVADEDALTRARATLDPAEFRRRATAFDERVTAVRQERDDARLALARQADRDRALFFQAAGPVLTSVMEQRGALLVLDQRTVLISAETIDVTAATIAALDGALGDGSDIVAAAIADEEAAATRPAPAADADTAAPAAATGTDTPIAAPPAPTDAVPTPAPDRAP